MSTSSQIPSAPIEARAKRTHARRSCDVCKVRKTRCELPDLEVPSGPNPLPSDKACHRCRVLALPCIVDDSGKKQRKRARDEKESKPSTSAGGVGTSLGGIGQQTESNGSTPKRRAPKINKRQRSSSQNQQQRTETNPSTRRHSLINHSLDVLQGILPLALEQPASLDEASRIQLGTTLYRQSDMETAKKSMKLHGRPAELSCAMLSVAYGKVDVKRRPPVDVEDCNLNELIDEQMRARLQPGFSQLKTYHPHLDTLEALYAQHNKGTEVAATSLLLSTVIYLASLSLPSNPSVLQLRTTLTPFISHYRNRIILQTTKSFATLQALELLVVHAPLGILPLELTNLRDLAVARGVHLVITYLMTSLRFEQLVDNILSGPGPVFTFDCPDFWLWASLIADQATATFEDFESIKPEHLANARRITNDFMNYSERAGLWHDCIARGDIAILVGRLSVCDRLARSEEVLDSLARLRGALEISASDPTFDPVREILIELGNYERRVEEVDRRHDTVMGVLSGSDSRGVETACLSYRAVRRRYETGKVYVTGLRMLMATHYLPGSLHGYPDLPPSLPISQAVDYATSRAHNPADIIKFITDTAIPKPAVEAVWDWGRKRGVNTEACLVACADIGQNLVNDLHNGGYISIIPLLDVCCIATEAAKVLIEMEAGTIQILRSTNQIHKAFRARSWLVVMNQVSQIFRSIGEASSTDDLGGDCVANGCSNLIGSMVRSAESWTKSLEKEIPSDMKLDNDRDQHHGVQEHEEQENKLPPYVLDSGRNDGYTDQQQQHHPQANLHESLRQASASGISSTHQQYMDSSDRWMASSEVPLPPSSASSGHLHPPQQLPSQHEHLNSAIAGNRDHSQAYHQIHQQHPNSNDGRVQTMTHSQPQQSGPYPDVALDRLLSEMFCYSIPPQGSQGGVQNRTIQPGHPIQHHQIQSSWPQDMRSQ